MRTKVLIKIYSHIGTAFSQYQPDYRLCYYNVYYGLPFSVKENKRLNFQGNSWLFRTVTVIHCNYHYFSLLYEVNLIYYICLAGNPRTVMAKVYSNYP